MTTEPALLGGRYEIGEVLGYGGMAEVHRGRDTRLGRDVAVKVLRADLARDPTAQARFRREAQSAAALSHPSIVAVFDTGVQRTGEGSSSYIVMEYVEGDTLRDVLRVEGRLQPQRALSITASVCAALEHAHRMGIVHRDVKPGNVMLTRAGQVKVMDFGIARSLTNANATMTQTAAVIGTAQYLSPEQARGEHVDARSDIYSVGCLLYELLTGVPPFTGDSAVAIAYQHVREEPVPPSQLEPDLPAGVDAIVLKAMAKNPANRYQSAAEMRADLERVLTGRPVQAAPVAAAEHPALLPPPPTTVLLRQPQRRGRRVAGYTLLFLATVLVFVIALLVARGLLSGGTGEVNTPNVVGRTLADAEAILRGKGLHVGQITQQYDRKVAKGTVLAQDPAADILLKKGGSVDLVVSRGIRLVTVPDLVGLPQGQARTALKAAGLGVRNVVPRNSAAPAGQVLDTDPAGGLSVPAGSEVTLYVSNAQVRVPNVVGRDLATAEALLEQRGFTVVSKPAAVFDRKVPAGQVVDQTPPGGTYAAPAPDDPVTIYYNQKPTPSPTPSPSPTPTPTRSPSPTPSSSPSSAPSPSVVPTL